MKDLKKKKEGPLLSESAERKKGGGELSAVSP